MSALDAGITYLGRNRYLVTLLRKVHDRGKKKFETRPNRKVRTRFWEPVRPAPFYKLRSQEATLPGLSTDFLNESLAFYTHLK